MLSSYQLYKIQETQLKNRIHSLLKEQLYGCTQEELFDRKSRKAIREISNKAVLRFQLNALLDRLERDEEDTAALKEQLLWAAPSRSWRG
jgi:transposase